MHRQNRSRWLPSCPRAGFSAGDALPGGSENPRPHAGTPFTYLPSQALGCWLRCSGLGNQLLRKPPGGEVPLELGQASPGHSAPLPLSLQPAGPGPRTAMGLGDEVPGQRVAQPHTAPVVSARDGRWAPWGEPGPAMRGPEIERTDPEDVRELGRTPWGRGPVWPLRQTAGRLRVSRPQTVPRLR